MGFTPDPDDEPPGGGAQQESPAVPPPDAAAASTVPDKLVVAVGDPANLGALEVVARFLGRPVSPLLAPPAAVAAAINAAYQQRTGQAQALIDALGPNGGGGGGALGSSPSGSPADPGEDRDALLDEVRRLAAREDLLDNAARAPVIRLVNLLLFEAVQSGASDVHVQPTEDRLAVRTRIDGVLYDSFSLPKGVQDEVISRVK
jgi:general secretion pathway protein E